MFDLATRLGLGAAFWEGDIDAAFRHQLAPSGITLEELRAHPEGVRVPLVTRYRKYAGTGFATPSGKVELDTPHGRVRARARLNPSLDPQVVVGQHGWWEACHELGLPGYPPYGPDSANLNLVLRQTPSDPISGSSPLRASVCDISRLDAAAPPDS